jgi:hypothetical protein
MQENESVPQTGEIHRDVSVNTGGTRNRRRLIVIGLLLFINIALRLAVAWRPLEYIDGLTIPDDAYISLHLARNIAAGLGPSYAGEYTNGFQPLYVFLMVPVFAVLQNDLISPIRISLTLACLVDTLTLWLILRLLRPWTSSLTAAGVLASAWIVNPYVIVTTVNGLETAIASCIVVWGWYTYAKYCRHTEVERRPGKWLVLGLVLGLAVFARIDAAFFVLAVSLTHLVSGRKDIVKSVKEVLIMGCGVFVAILPWLVYSLYYTGLLFPVSGEAVRFMTIAEVSFDTSFQRLYLPSMKSGGLTILNWDRGILAGLAASAVVLFMFRKRMTPRTGKVIRLLLPGWLFALFIFEAYTLYIFGPWFYPRYLYPICIVLMVTFGWTLGRLFATEGTPARRTLAAVLVGVICLGVNLFDSRLPPLFNSTETHNQGYMNLGIWANRSFTPGTVLGGMQSGALGYFATNMSVVNLDGVVSKSCYDALVDRRGMDFMRQRKVQFVLGWKINVSFLTQQSEFNDPDDLTIVGEISGFKTWGRSWYLYRVKY